MIIPIEFSASNSSPKLPHGLAKISNDEIVLVELQGSLDVEAKSQSERNGKVIGRLTIDDAMSKPTLHIGHHLLEGKIATINKPLAILHRARSTPCKVDSNGFMMDVDNQETQVEESQTIDVNKATRTSPTPWMILGLVRKKIIFSKRPVPVAKASHT